MKIKSSRIPRSKMMKQIKRSVGGSWELKDSENGGSQLQKKGWGRVQLESRIGKKFSCSEKKKKSRFEARRLS